MDEVGEEENRTFQNDAVVLSQNDSSESETKGKIPTIEEFEFMKPISRGAFGKVFLGHKKSRPDKLYAIKVMKKADMVNKNLTSQVITERDAMVKSAGPFVVQLYYSIQSQQNIFLVMEYLIGGDVKSLLGVAGYFEESMAILYVAEVTLALEYLHSKGIIHRDLKPDNMLVTAEGHIKLTDFGLSKFNINFNPHDIARSPKTPMPYSQHFYHHTPGQILSLHSNLAFSTRKYGGPMAPTTPVSSLHHGIGHPINSPITDGSSQHTVSPLSEISPNVTPSRINTTDSTLGTPNISRVKYSRQSGRSMRDVVLAKSATQLVDRPVSMASPGTPGTPGSVNDAPVKRLLSTLQDTLNWTESTGSRLSSTNATEPSPEERGSPELLNRPLRMSGPDHNDSHAPLHIGDSDGDLGDRQRLLADSCSSMSDNVFDVSEWTDMEIHVSSAGDGGAAVDEAGIKTGDIKDEVFDSGRHTCSSTGGNVDDCDECASHMKVPSRQEKFTDETPQMHRSDDSLRNSYAAKHLRSLRDGSYSEDDVSNKENVSISSLPNANDKNTEREIKPKSSRRRLTKAKSFSYVSNEDGHFGLNCNSGINVGPGKKRGYCDVEQSPVRRTHSAESGLTRELYLLNFSHIEPHSKRSNSIPRTRIRFHSGQHAMERDTISSENDVKRESAAKKCLSHVNSQFCDKAAESSEVDDRDKIGEGFYVGDIRINAGHSVNDNDDNFDVLKKEMSVCMSSSVGDASMLSPPSEMENDVATPDIVITQVTMQQVIDKRLQHLQKPMVSSLKSESDVALFAANLSSIHGDDGEDVSQITDAEISVFDSKDCLVPERECSRCVSPLPMLPDDLSMPKPSLLPPPLPKPRRLSGSGSVAGSQNQVTFRAQLPHVPCDNIGRLHRTPEPANRPKIFCTPNIPYCRTPRTQQAANARSQSFCYAAKTPYRTPKSVRRAPAPVEERILGTPDYLAPEILLQKPHDAAVDWWSLGVCMFEFLTGIPPFNDQTPDLVFENILNRDIPWPVEDEELTTDCRDAIDSLLTLDTNKRPRARDVRRMAAFRDIDWHHVLDMKPPFVPEPEDQTDTGYFEARNMAQNLFVSDVDF